MIARVPSHSELRRRSNQCTRPSCRYDLVSSALIAHSSPGTARVSSIGCPRFISISYEFFVGRRMSIHWPLMLGHTHSCQRRADAGEDGRLLLLPQTHSSAPLVATRAGRPSRHVPEATTEVADAGSGRPLFLRRHHRPGTGPGMQKCEHCALGLPSTADMMCHVQKKRKQAELQRARAMDGKGAKRFTPVNLILRVCEACGISYIRPGLHGRCTDARSMTRAPRVAPSSPSDSSVESLHVILRDATA